MKRSLSLCLTAILLLTGVLCWAQSNYSTTYTSNVTLSTEGGTNASTCKVKVNDVDYDGIKAGTSSKAGAWKVTVPAGTTYLHLHVAAWKSENVTLTASPSGLVEDIALTNNDGISNNSPYTFNGDPSSSNYYKVISFSNLTADTDITFSATSGKRFVVFGVNSETGGGTTTPSINADNVDLAYDATSGNISYNISNPVTGGVLTAATTSEWLTTGTVGTTVPLSCSANADAAARTATVTLTYTYNTSQTVTKNVTVTQAGNPNVINTISEITSTGNYTVQGTVVAISNRGFVLGDGSGYVYYYVGSNFTPSNYNIGDKLKLSGAVTTYGGAYQFGSNTTITTSTTSNYVTEDPTVITGAQMDARVANTTPAQLASYVQYEGKLTVSGTYYNITDIEGATTAKGSISYPLNTDFISLDGKQVIVKGYYVGISSSTYYNTMLGSIEEATIADPELTVSATELSDFSYTLGNGPSAAKSFTVSGSNLTANVTVTAPTNFQVCATANGTYANSLTLNPPAGTLNTTTVYVRMIAGLAINTYSGNLTVASTGATSKTVALSGEVTSMPVVETPTFTPAEGSYAAAQSVTITCSTEDATIRYTLDGTEPNENSTVYALALNIETTTTVKAKAWKDGYTASDVASATYTIATPAQETAYTLITNVNGLVAGEKYIIVGIKGEDYKALGKQNTNNRIAVDVTSISNAITVTPATLASDETAPFELTLGQSNGHWTFFDAVNNGYLYAASATANYLKTQATADANGEWTIEIANDGVATIKAQGTNTRNWLRLNNNGTPFSCYSSGQLDVYLYKAGDVPPATNPTITVTPTDLSDFNYVANNGPSSSQSFTLSGSNLTEDVTVTAPTNFEICATETGTYATTLTLTPNNGTLDATSVFVRMVAGLSVGDYSGSLNAVSGEANASVALSGSVTSLPLAATPTFSLAEGTFLAEQSVSIGCTTEGATIYYTTDGTNPTANSTAYTEPITISETTTLKAVAFAEGYAMSAIASATYTIAAPVNIANVRALANNEMACVEGTVIFIDGRNVYIQDATAGIDLYLNEAVRTDLALGDNVRAYGKKTVYKGLVELTGINGNDDNEFAILSNGHELPLAETTIAAINADFAADNLLQSTRVKIAGAVIGAINPTSTTIITQEGESLNIYKIPEVEGLMQGDLVTVTGVIGCYNTPQLMVASADDVVFSQGSSLVASPSTLSGMTYAHADGGPSNIVSFNFSGTNLTSFAEVFPSESFEVSTFPDSLFAPENPAVVNAITGNFYDIKIYVRLKAGLAAGTYSEQLTLASADVDTIYVNVTGTVTGVTPPTPPTPPVGDGNYVRISDLSQLADGSQVIIASRYNATANAYEAAANTLTNNKLSYTAFVSITDNNNEILPAVIADAENEYYWTVGVNGSNYTFTNANGDVLSYNSGTNFNFTGNKTAWTIANAVSDTASLVPSYNGFTIINVDTDNRAIALRYNPSENFNVFGAYSTSNMTNAQASQYNFFLDLFVKTGDAPTPPTPIVATPVFTPASGTYTETQTVSITCATEGATIHYTTDGTNPTTNSIVYTTPITIDTTTTVKAFAVMDGYDDSAIATAEYVIEDEPTPPTPVEGDYVRIGDLSALTNGDKVILASRYNATADAYKAIANTLTSGKLGTTDFTSTMSDTDEIIPESIAGSEESYYWTVNITANGYTFTNADGQTISYNSSTNFNLTGDKTTWNISLGTSEDAALVPNYTGFNIINVDTDSRGFALRVTESASVVGAYSTSNMNNAEYNFFLDIFRKGEGGGTPTVAIPTFSPAAGTYYAAQEVTINCATDGATIHFSTTSENGPWTEYEDAITVAESTTIWAYATKDEYNDSPVASASYVINTNLNIIFNQDWEGDWHGWTQVSVEGDETEWTIADHQGNHYAYINGYNHGANEDWLISPAFDLDSYTGVVLTFRTARNYNGNEIEVFFSNDYDGSNPTTATWQPLACALSQGSWNWVESGSISLDGYSGNNCYIAYKYTCTEDEAAAWEVDDIMLTSDNAGIPSITATPNALDFEYLVGQGPSASKSYILTSANLEGQGNVSVTVSDNFQIALDNANFGSSLSLEFANGIITNQPLTVYVRMAAGLDSGTYTGTITHNGGGATETVTLTGIVIGEGEPYIESIVPLYIQGNNGSNNNRVPVATEVFVHNLAPNTTYRYTNQFVDSNDGPETAGAGNVIYADADRFYRSTSPSLATEGGYGLFTTDEEGKATVWCVNEPTANARFTPGNQVYLRIRVNDGNDGTSVAYTFTSQDYATVLNFGTERDEYQGTAFYAKSVEAPRGFAMMYAQADELRPIYATSIETVGVDYSSINQYANFYKELVAGNDGWFGGILPNDNESGINYIAIVKLDGTSNTIYSTENGFWQPEGNTVNPNGGLETPIFIDLTYTSVEEGEDANVTVWNTGNEFVIENADESHYVMTVYNLLGQPMMQRQVNANSIERISHNLACGLYIINLQNSHNKVAAKVIVK